MTDRRVALVLDIGFGTLLGSRRSAERMTAHLQARGFEVLALQGADVTRDRIRGELLHARRQLGPGDAFALYFVGHGDRLRADGGPPRPGVPQAVGDVMLLITHDLFEESGAPGVAGSELVEWLEPIAEATDNVTVILDCCRAATMAAGSLAGDEAAHARIAEVLAAGVAPMRQKYGVAAPRAVGWPASIVRLVATTENETAVERLADDGAGRIGLFTDTLVRALERHPDSPWDDLLQTVQLQVGAECRTQLPGVEGPRWRLPFSRAERPPIDQFPCVEERGGWRLLAGALHGVAPGDRFTLADAAAEVVEVAPDVAVLRFDAAPPAAPALRLRRVACARRDRVAWAGAGEPPPELARALAGAPELELVQETDDAVAALEADGDARIVRVAGEVIHVEPTDEAGRLVHALRRAARWQRQHAALERLAGPAPLHLAWGLDGQEDGLPTDGATLPEGARLWLQVWSDGTRPELYVSLFHRRADCSLLHVNHDLDHGAIVTRRRSVDLTETAGGEPRPIAVEWCPNVPRDRPRDEELILLVSSRPRALHRVATAIALGPAEPAPDRPRGEDDGLLAALRVPFRVEPRAG